MLGPVGSADAAAKSASPLGQFTLCANGNYRADAEIGNITISAPAGGCAASSWAPTSGAQWIYIEVYVHGGKYIASASFNASTSGLGVTATGTGTSPGLVSW